jgi:hypothetical protein
LEEGNGVNPHYLMSSKIELGKHNMQQNTFKIIFFDRISTTAHNCTRRITTSPDRTLGEGALSVLHLAICLFNESNTSTQPARVNTSA